MTVMMSEQNYFDDKKSWEMIYNSKKYKLFPINILSEFTAVNLYGFIDFW